MSHDLYTKEWFAGKDVAGGQPRLCDVAEEKYDPVIPAGASEELTCAKVSQFMTKAHEWGRRIPIGLLLENRTLSTFEQRIAARIPSYRGAPPARRVIADAHGHPTTDLHTIFAELAIT